MQQPDLLRAAPDMLEAERLTLGVLLSGVAALALSDFVSPLYWTLVVLAAVLRFALGERFSLSEMQASLIGWLGFFWVGAELVMHRPFLVAFTDFLLILSLAVVVERPTPRNHLHRPLVGMFLVLAAAVLTDSVLYALPLAAFLLLIWRASERLYGMNWPGGDLSLGPWRVDVKVVFGIMLGTVLLFVLVPRYGFGSFLQQTQPRMETSGFGDTVELGDFARELDPTVMMRIEPAPGTDVSRFRQQMIGRYWRGTTLSIYTGKGWKKGPESTVGQWVQGADVLIDRNATDAGRSLPSMDIVVYREATDHNFLLVPDGLMQVQEVEQAVRLGDAGSMQFLRAPSRRMRLLMQVSDSHESHLHLSPPSQTELGRAEEVPKVIVDWAAGVVGNASAPAARMARLVGELSSWDYDLNAPIDSEHPVEYFIQTSRRGHCELFASALALAARSQGVPARVVNGYSGGEWNDVGKFYLIRKQHAHSWVEVWMDNRWQRYDATPPSRWGLSGIRFPQFDAVWESVKLAWYRYVLSFSNEDRNAFWGEMLKMLRQSVFWVAVAALVGVLALRWRKLVFLRKKTGWYAGANAREAILLAPLDRWLRRRGMHRHNSQPVAALPSPKGVAPELWLGFVRGWERQAFGAAEFWSRRVLMRHLRALSSARW